jgi:archaeal flagellar protein FlaJ
MEYENKSDFLRLKEIISKEKKLILELGQIENKINLINNADEKKMANSQISKIKNQLEKIKNELKDNLEKTKFSSPFPKTNKSVKEIISPPKIHEEKQEDKDLSYIKKMQEKNELQNKTLKRLKRKKEKKKEVKEKKPSKYIQISNSLFSKFSVSLLEKGNFRRLRRDLRKTNIQMLTKSYLSFMFFTTIVSFFIGIFLFLFFLFFNLTPLLPIIIPVEIEFSRRFLHIFWIIPLVPILTFFSAYLYPGLEKQSLEGKINKEIPFATIHMSSISGSMINPSNIFRIIVSTHEYPTIEKEFIKILNEINVLGSDIVTALRNNAMNSPSKRLSELLNGLAITITSGGDIPEFFEKRAQSLLFEYRLEREKATKASETFMDIYISTVIAGPMILMLLWIYLSTGMISLIMILGVSSANIFFLIFIHLRNQNI